MSAGNRPAVSVVIPFRGDLAYAERTRDAIARLRLEPGDEVVVADNTADGIALAALAGSATVVAAAGERSSYHARNAGAALATTPWLLFMDADCVPVPDLLDRYFAAPVKESWGAVAGSIHGLHRQHGLLARYARDRNFLDQGNGMHSANGIAAATGNLLVRRATFEALDGFAEGIRSAGDVDFCWRLHRAGWRLGRRPRAIVEHRHREDLASFLAMIARYGAGARWLNERHPGSAPRWPLGAGLAQAGRDIARLLATGRLEPAAFRAIDGLGLVAHNLGYRAPNELR